MIHATKNGQRKPFTQLAWDNLGANKNGWVLETDQVSTNKAAMPETGQGAVKTKDQVSTNKAAKSKPEETQLNEVANQTSKDAVFVASDEFKEVAAPIKRNSLKDFLDIHAISYKQNDKIEVLVNLVAEKLKNNVELLKSDFGL